jgi:hypothetical protein
LTDGVARDGRVHVHGVEREQDVPVHPLLYRYSDTMAASFVILTCFIEIFIFFTK